MQPKYEYRRRLPHYQKDDHPLFVTFTTDHRWQVPPIARILFWHAAAEKMASSSISTQQW